MPEVHPISRSLICWIWWLSPICWSLKSLSVISLSHPSLSLDYSILQSSISSEPSIQIRNLMVHDPLHIAHRHSITPSTNPSPIAICNYILTVDQARDPTIRIKLRDRYRCDSMAGSDFSISLKGFPSMRYSLLHSPIPRFPIRSGPLILICDSTIHNTSHYCNRSPLSQPFHSNMPIRPIAWTW